MGRRMKGVRKALRRCGRRTKRRWKRGRPRGYDPTSGKLKAPIIRGWRLSCGHAKMDVLCGLQDAEGEACVGFG